MSLEIIGPGFGRTGTNSLKLAFEQLGFGPCHHMFEVRDNPERIADWQAAADGQEWTGTTSSAATAHRPTGPAPATGASSPSITPTPRSCSRSAIPDEWFDSVQATIAPLVAARGTHSMPIIDAIGEFVQKAIVEQTFDGRLSDRAHATRVFRDHIAQVKATIHPDRLLVFDMREGWEPLCDFLGVAIPDTPYPKTNSSREFVARGETGGSAGLAGAPVREEAMSLSVIGAGPGGPERTR